MRYIYRAMEKIRMTRSAAVAPCESASFDRAAMHEALARARADARIENLVILPEDNAVLDDLADGLITTEEAIRRIIAQ